MELKHEGHVRVGKDLKSLEVMLIPQSVSLCYPLQLYFALKRSQILLPPATASRGLRLTIDFLTKCRRANTKFYFSIVNEPQKKKPVSELGTV